MRDDSLTPSPPDNHRAKARRARRIALGVLLALAAAVVIFALTESWLSRAVIAAALVAVVALYRSAVRPVLPIVVAVSAVVVGLYVVGSYSRLLDLAALATAAIVVALVGAGWTRVRRSPESAPAQRWPIGRRASWAIAIGFVLASWLALSATDSIAGRVAARREWSSGHSACPAGLPELDRGGGRAPRVAVAVSGGGYRAALFHAGVLAGLGCVGIPVSAVSTVSGGSIIGAYYAVGGEPHAFRSMVSAGLFNVKRELLHAGNLLRFGRSLVSELVGYGDPDRRFTQTDIQASLIDRLLYRGLRMSDLDSIGGPRLLVNVTDLVSGERIALGARGALESITHDPVNRQDYANPTGLVGWYGDQAVFREATADKWPSSEPISRIVAASGAFPGAMRPVAVFVPKSDPLDSTTTGGWYVLADGGIADNTGLATVRDAIGLAREYSVYGQCVARYTARQAGGVESTRTTAPVTADSAARDSIRADSAVSADGPATADSATAVDGTSGRDAAARADTTAGAERASTPESSRASLAARCGEPPWGTSPALEQWLVDIVVMSDGSAMSKASMPTTTLGELGRTADVMYRMSGPQRPSKENAAVAQTPVLLVSPQAFQRGGDDSVFWSSPLESLPRNDVHRDYRMLQLWAFGLDVATIRFMVDHMPPADRTRATEALTAAQSEGRIMDGVWRGASGASRPPTDAERTLHELLKSELRRRIATFAAASTLRDQYDAETADSLFLLGQYLVLINRSALQEHVARAVYPRAWEAPEGGG